MADEEADFPFEELPEKEEAVLAAPADDEESDYLSVPLTVVSTNRRADGDGKIEMMVNAIVQNPNVVSDGLKVTCSINLRITGPSGSLPKVDVGSVVDLLV